MGTGLVGLLVVLVALIAMVVWLRVRRARGSGVAPTDEPADPRGLPEDRPTTWDPRERYD